MTRFSNSPSFVPACLPLLPACGFTQADHPPVHETVELDKVYVTAERRLQQSPGVSKLPSQEPEKQPADFKQQLQPPRQYLQRRHTKQQRRRPRFLRQPESRFLDQQAV